jgi:hypothetical protein
VVTSNDSLNDMSLGDSNDLHWNIGIRRTTRGGERTGTGRSDR